MKTPRSSISCHEGSVNELDLSGWKADGFVDDLTNDKEPQSNTKPQKTATSSLKTPSVNIKNTASQSDIKHEVQGPTTQTGTQSSNTYQNHWDNLPRLLRAFGGATLLVAVTIYLFQGSQAENEFFRYFILLGHTVLLTILGFFSGRALSDSKGARTLVALALASVPANFAILGGFIRSQFINLDNINTIVPTALTWTADSLSGALFSSAVALAFLTPVVYVGFLVLCRPLATAFSALFLFGNIAMLFPARSPFFIAGLMTIIGFLIVRHTYANRERASHLATFEGGIAQLILLSPLAVIIGRSLCIYGADTMLVITVTGFMLGFLRFSQTAAPGQKVSKLIEPARLLISPFFCFQC